MRQQASRFIKSHKNTLSVTEIEIEGVPYHFVCFPLGSKPKFLGLLIILSTKKMGEMDIAALKHACTVLSLELFKEQAVFDTQQRLNGEFVTKLYSGNVDEALIQKAKSLNLNPEQNYIAIIIEFSPVSIDKTHSKEGLIRKMIQMTNHAFLKITTKASQSDIKIKSLFSSSFSSKRLPSP